MLAAAALVGCGRADGPANSAFYSSFSIGKIVEANSSYLSTGASTVSGAEAGMREPFLQRQEAISIPIEAGNAAAFMAAIESSVEEAILSSGAQIEGRGSGGSEAAPGYFWLAYRQDAARGTIHVWGMPGEEGRMSVVALITER